MTLGKKELLEVSTLRFLTAGESHGPELSVVVEGFPAGLSLTEEDINVDLRRRQIGYGRGGRMKIEKDAVTITGGVRFGETLGSPIALRIVNRDYANWLRVMSIRSEDASREGEVTSPRPGHADLAGHLKYDRRDLRDILERASARETASRVAAGAIARKFLSIFGVQVLSHTLCLGETRSDVESLGFSEIRDRAEQSELRCADPRVEKKMVRAIDRAREDGDTLGGVLEILVDGVVPGLGSHVHWDRKLDGRLAQALMSIQAIKGVSFGMGFEVAGRPGSEVHDEITWESGVFERTSNNAGGLEGGMTNGQMLVIQMAMKPISTLRRGLGSVDLTTMEPSRSAFERSDVTAVPSAGVVGEAAVAFVLADACLEKFGGDSLREVERNYHGYCRQIGRPGSGEVDA